MIRRSFLKGMVAGFATILVPFKSYAGHIRLTPGKFEKYIRVQIPTYATCSHDLDPRTGRGSFNLFLNTPYRERMSPAVFASEQEFKEAILSDRQQIPTPLGPDLRQRWVDEGGRKHDHRLHKQITEAIKAHKPFISPSDGGALTGA